MLVLQRWACGRGTKVAATVAQKGVTLAQKGCKDELLCTAGSFAGVWFQQSMCAASKGSEEAAMCSRSVLRGSVREMSLVGGGSSNHRASSKPR